MLGDARQGEVRALRIRAAVLPNPAAPSRPKSPPGAWRVVVLLVGLLATFAQLSSAEGSKDAGPGDGSMLSRREAVERRQADVATRVLELRAGPAADPERLALLEHLERLLSQILDELARGEELASRLEAARESMAQPPEEQLGHRPPYSLAEYDDLIEQLEAARRLLNGLEEAVAEAGTSVEAARKALDEAERRRRADRGASAAGARPDIRDLRVEVAEVERELRRIQLEAARRAQQARELQVTRLRDVVEWVENRVVPDPDELEARTARLDDELVRLSQRREQAELQLQPARRRWELLVARAAEESGQDSALRAETSARRAEFVVLQKRVALLGEQIERLERARVLLERRAAVFAAEKPSRSELVQWDDESAEALASLTREIRVDQAEQAAFAQELRTLEESIGTGPDRSWQTRRAKALRETLAVYEENLGSLEAGRQAEEQLRRTLKQGLGSFDLTERVSQLGSIVRDVWRFEVTSSEDRSITIGKIAIGALVFVFGLLVARGFTQWLAPRVLNRARMDEGAAHAYQSLLYYALLAIAFITALRIVDIPLTAFAVVGGALAIGVGFGSQNVVNNFISGLILLAERPIKRGDLVELAGTYGNIERIGLRSTRVRTGDNVHVIVPNSAFLENNVVNWTHNDRQVRIRITVGVVYGSPTRQVETLIRQAIDEHPKVQKKPEPIVLFTEFGDNSLNFEARFWVSIRSLIERLRIESDLRFRIDDLFREAQIVIAFPQRDVHLDAAAPIPVQLIDGGEKERGPS